MNDYNFNSNVSSSYLLNLVVYIINLILKDMIFIHLGAGVGDLDEREAWWRRAFPEVGCISQE